MASEVDRFSEGRTGCGIDHIFGTTVLHALLRIAQLAILEFFLRAVSRSVAAST